jgi:MacB-like periplasmic core domain
MTNIQHLQASSDEIQTVTSARYAKWARFLVVAVLIGGGTGISLELYGLLSGLLTTDNTQAFEVFHSRLESRRVGEFSYSEIGTLYRASTVFASVSAYSPIPVTISGGRWQQKVDGSFITEDYFATLGSRAALGNDLSCSGRGASPCLQVILSSELWRERFASDPNVIGRTITIDGRPFTVRGVLASGTVRVDVGRDPALWIPVQAEPALVGMDWTNESSKVRWLLPVVQFRAGVTPEAAESALTSLFHHEGDFLVLTPGQANLARAFRIRGAVVRALSGRFLKAAFWTGIFVWALALNWLAVFVAAEPIPALKLVALALIETATAMGVSLVAKRVLDASLGLFGVPEVARQHQVSWQWLSGIALILTCAGLVVYLVARPSRREASSSKSLSGMLNTGWVRSLSEHRYLILSAVLLVLIAGYTANGLAVSDFWEHAAVVRELAAHPLHPPNPILPVNAPHAGYSPYALALGLLSRFSDLSAVDASRVAGIFNVLLVLCTFGMFVRATFPAKHTDFYALLFVLFLWGFFPWYFSGFLHLNALGIVAASPSTFATGMVFLAWYISVLMAKGGSPWLLLPVTLILADVCLDHPLTAISMFVGLFALTLDFGRSWASMLQLAIVCAAAFLLACAWPYYDIRALLMSRTGNFDTATSGMYPGLLKTFSMIFPALIGLPLLIRRFRCKRRDFVSIIFALLSAIYAFGWLSGKLTLGRVMPFIILMLQLAAADWLARFQTEPAADDASLRTRWTRNLILAATALGAIMMLPGFISSIPIFQSSYGEYKFLPRYVSERDSVLSDFDTSLRIPAFGAKVVAYPPVHVLFFVDSKSRDNDDEHFFSPATSDAEKKRILDKYSWPFVLINKYRAETWPDILRSIGSRSTVAYSDGDMLLLQTKS